MDEDDYYLNISVQSLVEKYAGRKKGYPINVELRQIEQLKKMQAMFGENFGWNEIICFGFYSVKKHRLGPFKSKFDIDVENCEQLYVKPTRKTLFAIVAVGQQNAAEQLIDIGFHFLLEKFSENA
ncbi:hypothetical protein DIR46_01640 [Massilia oculi]|uniref:Uncharacterized protein n=1 Tax=Massilia oculi TaxID=945844 RepID=A0A2S2DD57_9BURK|nr:hypothetical protein DIR46_01640 [Massilia oculi]